MVATSKKEQLDTILPEEKTSQSFHIGSVGNTQGEGEK